MPHRNVSTFTSNLALAKRLIEARTMDVNECLRMEEAITLELVGSQVLARDEVVHHTAYPQHRYMTPLAATEACADELHRAVAWFASYEGLKTPVAGKYNPLFATPVTRKGIFQLRQVADEIGVSYRFFAEAAVRYWSDQGNKRIPRPTQLCTLEVVMHVMECWADPSYRYFHPLFGKEWDPRFDAENYVGDEVQLAALELIDQRIADARALGLNPASCLGAFLGRVISQEDAVRRYGNDLVDSALEANATASRETAAMIAQGSLEMPRADGNPVE